MASLRYISSRSNTNSVVSYITSIIKMKYLVIIALFFTTFKISHQNKFAGTMVKNYFKTHEEVRKQCMAEINVDSKLEDIFEDLGEVDDDEDLRCFTKCVLIASGAITKTGELLPENIARNMQFTDVSLAYKLIEECPNYDRVDLCKGAKQLIDCSLDYLESVLKP